MPTYSYACTACDHKFDAVQAFTDDALTTCPQCAGRLRKMFNSVGVVFKGSGFYRTDSREAQKGSASGSGGSDSTSPEKAGSEKTGSEKTASDTTASPAKASDSGSSGSSKPSASGASRPTAAASTS